MLDAQTKALLDEMKASGAPPMCTLPVYVARAMFKGLPSSWMSRKERSSSMGRKKFRDPMGISWSVWPHAMGKK